ncbi:hypothetical protein HC723_04820 [Vibrio sp. S11_S32]|uniref:chalcone isomerase family protein n=1 Tax=Vibrio sp. S11_S32 TaxID=2720225 RepID=UPI0016810BD2|nr:chalcone isomerase family protein [Vibrio sp. S11_S32]MBD1575776.1 hypothetical protein [Vibrio sp. S11_S32]
MFKLCLSLILLSFSVSAHSDEGLNLAQLHKLGQGKVQYLFWDLYQAELFASHRNVDQSDTKALRLTYLKSISKNDLLEATQDQWQRLGITSNQTDVWLAELDKIWPNVSSGNQLTLLVNPQGVSTFYFASHATHSVKAMGSIKDVDFGPAFLSIWLSPKTSEPKLRQQLLGSQPQ